MGVDVSAMLFVGLLENEMPENTRELLEGKVEMYEGWEDDLDEDASFSEWIEYIKDIPGVKWDLEALDDSAYSTSPKTIVGFTVSSTDSLRIIPAEEIIQGIPEVVEVFQKLFGVAPKVYLFPRWW